MYTRNKKLCACIKVTSYATDDQRERIANRDNSGTKPTVAFSKVPRITLRSRPPSKLIDYNTLAASLFSLPSSVSRSISLSFPLTRYPRGLSRARSLRTLSVPRPHTRSHGEFYIPWVSCWLPSRVGLRFRCSVPLLPLGAVPLASLSLSHSRSFSSSVLRIPFNSLPPRPRTLSPCRTVVYISRGSFAHHRLAAVLASRESEFLPAAPPFLAFSLRPCVPLSLSLTLSVLSLASFGVSRTPPIYTCIPVHFVSTRSVAHASPLLLPFFPLLSAPSGSARARSRGPFPSRLSISSSQTAGTLVLLVLFAPFRFTTGAGRLCPPSLRSSLRPPVSSPRLFALLYRVAPPRPLLLTYPCSRRDSVGLYPRSLAARSPTVSSSVRCTFLSISPAGGAGGRSGGRFYKWFQPRTGAGVVFRVIGRRLCHAAAER